MGKQAIQLKAPTTESHRPKLQRQSRYHQGSLLASLRLVRQRANTHKPLNMCAWAHSWQHWLTIWSQDLLQCSHLILLALHLQRNCAEGDIADVAVEDVCQVCELPALFGTAPDLHQACWR